MPGSGEEEKSSKHPDPTAPQDIKKEDKLEITIQNELQPPQYPSLTTLLNSQDSSTTDNSIIPKMPDDRADVRVDILRDDNYVTWKWHMTMVLDSKGLMEYVNNEDKQDHVKAKQAATLISSGLNDDNRQKVINCTTAFEIWKALEANFENKSSSERSMLLEKFHSFKIRSTRDIGKALGEIKALVAKLKQLGASVDDEAVTSVILRALPESMKEWKRTWKMINGGEVNLNKLTSGIMAEINDMEKVENAAMFVKTNNWKTVQRKKWNGKPSQKNGYINQKPQNNAQHKPKPNNSTNYKPKIDQCNYCKAKGHWKKDCKKLKEKDNNKNKDSNRKNWRNPKAVSFMAFGSDSFHLDTCSWIADSGCSMHMTPNRHWISNYEVFETAKMVTLGDSHRIVALGSGNIVTTAGTMRDVYYVPELTANLFSISAATKNGIEVLCKGNEMHLKLDGENITMAKQIQGIYFMDFDIKNVDEVAFAVASLEQWHERFAHISKEKIKRMASAKIVKDLTISADPTHKDVCEDCAVGKCHRVPHKQSTTPRTLVAGASLHIDTVGPIKEPSIRGSKYLVLCKDEASAYRLARFVATKSEIPNEVKTMISQATLETGNKVLKLTSDNGTEYKNALLDEYLKDNGIDHKYSTEYTPQQNGLIERDIRTIIEASRVMLNKAKLPRELWAEAANTAIYVMNRCITNRNPNQTPYELWFGYKPRVSNLHKFGQQAIVMYRDRPESKLAEKGLKQTFVGYTERLNTFRFYDSETSQVYTSCDAVFLSEEGIPTPVRQRNPPEDFMIHSGPGIESEENSEPSDQVVSERREEGLTQRSRSLSDLNQSVYVTPEKEVIPEPSSTNHVCVNKKPRRCEVHPFHILPQRLRSGANRNHANLTTIEAEEDPRSYKEAMTRSDKKEWVKAMEEEIESLKRNDVWELVDRPNHNIVTNKWVLKIKRNPDGSIERYKARLVARGFSQVYGIDYIETYAPVVNMASIRMLFAHAAEKSLYLSQFDVKTAFLYGDLEETVYMEQPEGFAENSNKVCRLKRSLYGLKQSPRQWNQKFSTFLKDMDLQVSENDGCIFYRKDGSLIVAIYVDDGLILASNEQDIIEVMTALKERFEVHSVKATTFLGFQIDRSKPDEITLHQESYIKTILKRFDMNDAKPVDAPITMSKLTNDEAELDSVVPYREAIGSLMYAAVTTRIDIAYAVSKASRAVEKPTKADWIAVKRIFRYLKDKEKYGITYRKGEDRLVAYCDSDFAGDDKTGRSTTGLVINLAGGPIQWRSQRQKLVTLSSTEAEFVSICSTVKEVIWLRKLGLELGIIHSSPTKLYCDNQSAIRIASNEKCVHRTRHMKVQASYPREQMEQGEVDIEHIRTDKQLADMLTKPTSIQKYTANNSRLMKVQVVALALMCLLAVISPASGMIFERVSPLITEPTDYKVDGGTNDYEIEFVYINPCDAITNLTSHHKLPILRQMDNSVYEQLQKDCQHAYETEWLATVEDLVSTKTLLERNKGRKVQKRAVGIAVVLGAGLVFYAVTNLVVSLFGVKHVAQQAEEQVKFEAMQLRKFERQLTATKAIQEGIINATESLAIKLNMQEQAIERLTTLLPTVAWKSSQLYSSIGRASVKLRAIKQMYIYNKLNTAAASELWNTTEFEMLKPEDTLMEEIYKGTNHSVIFKFLAKKPASSVKIHKIVAFDRWDNLTDTPQLLSYDGPKYILHNETNDCIRGIETPDPKASWVLEECNDANSTDPKLEAWTMKAIHTDKSILPKVIKTLTYNYISCYKHNITVPQGTFECPPFPFKLSHDVPFSTPGHNYQPKTMKIAYKVGNGPNFEDGAKLIKTNVKDETNENSMLKAIRELKAANKATQAELDSSIIVAKYGTTWWIGFALSAFTTLITVLHAYTWIRSHVINIGRAREEHATELNQLPEYKDDSVNHIYPRPCSCVQAN